MPSSSNPWQRPGSASSDLNLWGSQRDILLTAENSPQGQLATSSLLWARLKSSWLQRVQRLLPPETSTAGGLPSGGPVLSSSASIWEGAGAGVIKAR